MPQASAMPETKEVIATQAVSELAEQSEGERSREIHNNPLLSGTANGVGDQAASFDEDNTVSDLWFTTYRY